MLLCEQCRSRYKKCCHGNTSYIFDSQYDSSKLQKSFSFHKNSSFMQSMHINIIAQNCIKMKASSNFPHFLLNSLKLKSMT